VREKRRGTQGGVRRHRDVIIEGESGAHACRDAPPCAARGVAVDAAGVARRERGVVPQVDPAPRFLPKPIR